MSNSLSEKTYYVTRTKLAFAFAQWIDDMRTSGDSDKAQDTFNSMLHKDDPLVPMAINQADKMIHYLNQQADPKEEDY